jgi:hypothetical protein
MTRKTSPNKHDPNCSWHLDQYDHECTCGRSAWERQNPPGANSSPAVYLLTCRNHGARSDTLYWSGSAGWTLSAATAWPYSEAERRANDDLSFLTVLDPAWVQLDDLCRDQTNQVDYDGSCLRCGAAMGERGRCEG